MGHDGCLQGWLSTSLAERVCRIPVEDLFYHYYFSLPILLKLTLFYIPACAHQWMSY